MEGKKVLNKRSSVNWKWKVRSGEWERDKHETRPPTDGDGGEKKMANKGPSRPSNQRAFWFIKHKCMLKETLFLRKFVRAVRGQPRAVDSTCLQSVILVFPSIHFILFESCHKHSRIELECWCFLRRFILPQQRRDSSPSTKARAQFYFCLTITWSNCSEWWMWFTCLSRGGLMFHVQLADSSKWNHFIDADHEKPCESSNFEIYARWGVENSLTLAGSGTKRLHRILLDYLENFRKSQVWFSAKLVCSSHLHFPC